jgi:hypothetical protein
MVNRNLEAKVCQIRGKGLPKPASARFNGSLKDALISELVEMMDLFRFLLQGGRG